MAGLQFSSGIDKGFENDLKRMNKQLNSFEKGAVKGTKNIDQGFSQIGGTIKDLVAFGGMAALANEVKNLTNETFKYRNELQKLTDLQGDALNTFTANLTASANTFGKSVDEMGLAVSNFAKGMDIDFEKALSLVDEGFLDGADSSKEFLDTLKEYSPLMKEAELSGREFIEAIKLQGDFGVKGDFGIDAIKEAAIRLREMPKATSDALKKVNVDVAAMQQGIQNGTLSYFEAAQQVSTKLVEIGANGKHTGEVIANVFGGPGENAGYRYLSALSEINGELGALDKAMTSAQKQERELLQVNKELQKAFADLLPDSNPLTDIAIGAKEALTWLIQNKETVIQLAAAIAGWKVGSIAMTQVQKIKNADVAKDIKLQHELMSAEAAKLKQALSAIAVQSKAAKERVRAIQFEIQAQKQAVLVASRSKDLQAARVAQEKIKNLEIEKGALVQQRATLQTQANTVAAKLNTTQVKASSLASKAAGISTNVFTKANHALGKSFKALKVALVSNPLGLLATALAIVVPLMLDFSDETDRVTESQLGLNKELERSKKLLGDYQDLQKSQKVIGALSSESLKEQKQNIQTQIRENEKANEAVYASLQDRITKDKQYQDAISKSNSSQLAGQQVFWSNAANTRKRELAKEVLDLYSANKDRINVLKENAKEIDKEIAKRKGADAAKKALEAQQKSLEIQHQERKNAIAQQYSGDLDAQEALHTKMLENDLLYLREKRKITTDELEKLRIDERIITTRTALSPVVSLPRSSSEVSVSSDVTKFELGNIKERLNVQKQTTAETKKSNLNFKDSVELFNEMNTIVGTLREQLSGVDGELGVIIDSVAGASEGLIGMVNGVNSVQAATSALEKASGILAVISAAIKLSDAISGAFDGINKKRDEAYARELAGVHSVNMALIEQNALYEEGNTLLASDSWGSALKGLETYNTALEFQKDTISSIATEQAQQGTTLGQDIGKMILDPLSGPLSLLGGRSERKQIEAIQKQAQAYTTELEKGLASIAVKTKEAGKVGSFFGQADQYSGLLDLYPHLIKANGDLDTEVLQLAIDSENLAEADKERLTQLVELTEAAEEAYANFGSYIADIFGGVGDEVAQAFQNMYETGDDAMSSLEGSMSDMIEAFTRDIVEFSLLQPLVNQVNEAAQGLGEQYAKGDLSAEELQSGIVDQLGSFYNSLGEIQPQILQAYENADKLAESAGFGAAFSGDTGTVAASSSSAAAQIKRDITEGTASEMVGRLNALMISNQGIYENSFEMLDLGVANLAALNKIVVNTDYLPEIASNTKKTYEKLSNL